MGVGFILSPCIVSCFFRFVDSVFILELSPARFELLGEGFKFALAFIAAGNCPLHIDDSDFVTVGNTAGAVVARGQQGKTPQGNRLGQRPSSQNEQGETSERTLH